ncbi:MAG: hypothetical protein LBC99_04035 [Spirochaetota bacterium]|jgi:hypothetical protein|nr:hypothetical protein [Spirochaetota bacterium]
MSNSKRRRTLRSHRKARSAKQTHTAVPGEKALHETQQSAREKRGRIPRLEQIVSIWLERLAAARSDEAMQVFAADITAWRAQVAIMLERHGVTPAALPAEQQRLFARTLLWSEEPWRTIIPQTALAFETAVGRLSPSAVSAEIQYLPHEGSLWRVTSRRGRLVIAIGDIFLLDAAGEMTERLARFLTSRRRREVQESRFLKQWTGSEPVLQYFFALERHIDLSQQKPADAAHDLQAMYAANNDTYFSGTLAPSELCWSPRLACCRTGYYNPMDNSITISRALNSPEVPEFVVAFVLYHEMLHQQSRLALLRGLGRAHDKAFREAERKFPRYAEAAAWLDRLAQGKKISPD